MEDPKTAASWGTRKSWFPGENMDSPSPDTPNLATFPELYDRLRALARRVLRDRARNHSLEPTDVVHEVFLEFADRDQVTRLGHQTFLAFAARSIREILVDHERRRGALKRGGGRLRVTLNADAALLSGRDIGLLDLDDALADLQSHHARQARVIELRYFGGLSPTEIATLLSLSLSTIKKDLRLACAWLHRRLGPEVSG